MLVRIMTRLIDSFCDQTFEHRFQLGTGRPPCKRLPRNGSTTGT